LSLDRLGRIIILAYILGHQSHLLDHPLLRMRVQMRFYSSDTYIAIFDNSDTYIRLKAMNVCVGKVRFSDRYLRLLQFSDTFILAIFFSTDIHSACLHYLFPGRGPFVSASLSGSV
jgi:hypothetical protein